MEQPSISNLEEKNNMWFFMILGIMVALLIAICMWVTVQQSSTEWIPAGEGAGPVKTGTSEQSNMPEVMSPTPPPVTVRK